MRKLVLLSTEKECQQEISRIADTIIMETADEVMQLLKEQQQNISVLLIIYPAVLLNRIQNAETLMNSVSFGEFARMLKALPANIYLKDASGRYVFSSQTWHHLDTGDDPNWTIAGKGTSYIIEEAGDKPEYLQPIKEPLFFEDGRIRGIIALINNVTEQELMRRQLREKFDA